MNMFARFDKNPAMTLQDIKKNKTLRMDGRTDNVKTVYPPQTKFAGGIIQHNDWLLADTCPQAVNHCALF